MLKHTLLRLLNGALHLTLGLAIVLIPTNLSADTAKESALVNGVLVDYLLPKLYLTDLVFGLAVLLLLAIAILTPRDSIKGFVRLFSRLPWLFPLFLLSLVASVSTSLYPLAGWWYLWRLLVICLAVYLFATKITLPQIKPWLSLAILSQALIGITQWIQKSSLIGYLFFGETELSVRATIATTAWFGELRPLPYGTTAHPNILAGFLAVSLTILLLIPMAKKAVVWWRAFLTTFASLLFIIISITSLALTQSLSGLIALCVGVIVSWRTGASHLKLIAFGGMVLGLSLFAVPMVDSLSVTRRLDLLEFSVEMIKDHPYLGVGPNNFTAAMPSYGEIPGPIRFYQPVHTIYMLAVSEIGVVGVVLAGMVVYQMLRRYSRQVWFNPGLIPLGQILIIGFFDHYPLTLHTGQLITALALAVAIQWSRTREVPAESGTPDLEVKKPKARKTKTKAAKKPATRKTKSRASEAKA